MSKVLFIAPVYNYYPVIVPSLQLQTHADWELLLVHDGPNTTGLKTTLEKLAEPRLRYYQSARRFDDWGHSLRALALESIATEPITGEHVVMTNGDNYYAPVFIEYMLKAFSPDLVAVYCAMVHSHRKWTVIDCELRHQWIDCGCVMVTREAVLEIGWRSRAHDADWFFIEEVVNRFGADRLKKIPNVLFVHN